MPENMPSVVTIPAVWTYSNNNNNTQRPCFTLMCIFESFGSTGVGLDMSNLLGIPKVCLTHQQYGVEFTVCKTRLEYKYLLTLICVISGFFKPNGGT